MQRVARERPERVVFVLNKADRAPFFETMFREAWAGCCEAGPDAGGATTPPPSPVWVKAVATAPADAGRESPTTAARRVAVRVAERIERSGGRTSAAGAKASNSW